MRFYGLFGNPLGHSISQQIHKKIYEQANLHAAYKNFEIEENELKAALEAMKLLDIQGSNITIPYKKKFIPFLDEISPLAERLQSVNTIKNNGGVFEGYNTDYDGIDLTFKNESWSVKGEKAFILGSGGASKAAAHYLRDQGAKSVSIVSRTPDKTNTEWDFISYEELAQQPGHILVNSTPVGMHPNTDASPVGKDIIQHFDILFDLTYNPAETLFLHYGNELGKETANGLDMLVGQAIRSVEIWEDKKLDEQTVQDILAYFRKNWQEDL